MDAYDAGSAMYVPFIPGMSVLKFSIDGTPCVCQVLRTCCHRCKIVPFSGETVSDRKQCTIHKCLKSNSIGHPQYWATITRHQWSVSFSASGLSDHARSTYLHRHGIDANRVKETRHCDMLRMDQHTRLIAGFLIHPAVPM